MSYNRSMILPEKIHPNFKRKVSLLKSAAKTRGFKLKINAAFYYNLLQEGCFYCGVSLLDESGYSIDRLDSNRGYVNSNIGACCKICNRAKSNMDQLEFLRWAHRVTKVSKERFNSFYTNDPSKADFSLLGLSQEQIKMKAMEEFKKEIKGHELDYTIEID